MSAVSGMIWGDVLKWGRLSFESIKVYQSQVRGRSYD